MLTRFAFQAAFAAYEEQELPKLKEEVRAPADSFDSILI